MTTITLGIKIAQKPYIVWSLGPKALIYESLDPQGKIVSPSSRAFREVRACRASKACEAFGEPREPLTASGLGFRVWV